MDNRRSQFSQLEDDRETDWDYGRGGGGYQEDGEQRGYHREQAQYNEDKISVPSYRRDDPYFHSRGSAEEHPAARQSDHRNSGRETSGRSQRLPTSRPLMSIPLRGEGSIAHGTVNPDQGFQRESLKRKAAFSPTRDDSLPKREVPPSLHTLSSRNYSPECSKISHPLPSHHSQPKKTTIHSEERPPGSRSGDSRDGSPHSSALVTKQNKTAGAGVEQDEETNIKEDPELTVEARRAHTIARKALEIEKLYRQDCETFGMVVKMLVDKQPNLEKQLQSALKENLSEIKERCMEDLRHFISEVNVVLKTEQH